MNTSLLRRRLGILGLLVATGWLCSAFAVAAEGAKPVFLYSRYFNAKGEGRYLPEGNYSDVLKRLGEDFEVRVNDLPLNAENLKGVAVVLISNPSDKPNKQNPPPPHVSAEDVRELTRFINAGGGLITFGNQEGHNLEINDFNNLLSAFGMKYENKYTDAKQLVLAADVPVIGGLRWAYYTGNQVIIEPNSPAKARPLIVNDLNQKPAKNGKRDEAGTLLAIAEPGKGHVVVATDGGWITNEALSGKGIGSVAIKEQDNFEIFRRLAKWAATPK